MKIGCMDLILRVAWSSYLTSCASSKLNMMKYDVHTTSKINHTRHFLSHIIFIANLSAILIGFCNVQKYNQTGMSWPTGL